MTKTKPGGKDFLQLTVAFLHDGKSGQKLKAGEGTEAEAMGNADLLPLACLGLAFSTAQVTGLGWHHPQWAGSLDIN